MALEKRRGEERSRKKEISSFKSQKTVIVHGLK